MTTPILVGTAVQVKTVTVKCECGFAGKAGYSEDNVPYGADAKVSFITTHHNPSKIRTLTITGSIKKVVRAKPSDYIDGMCNFYIKL